MEDQHKGCSIAQVARVVKVRVFPCKNMAKVAKTMKKPAVRAFSESLDHRSPAPQQIKDEEYECDDKKQMHPISGCAEANEADQPKHY